MQTGAHELSKLIKQRYVPSSIERKRAILMYLFVGIIIAMETKKISLYEMFHLKQALGWWTLTFLLLATLLFVFFLPIFIVRIIPVILFLLMAIVYILFMKQAWEGYYLTGKNQDKLMLPIFSGIGNWILSMFDAYYDEMQDLDEEYPEDETCVSGDVDETQIQNSEK